MSQEHAGPATHSQMSTEGQLRMNSKLVNSKHSAKVKGLDENPRTHSENMQNQTDQESNL